MLNTLLPNQINKTSGKKIKLRLRRHNSALLLKLKSHPLKPGQIFKSPGGTFKYKVVGACCRLYDRNFLPYPCCRLLWGSKEPFWNRIGKRFVPDIATKRSPSYCVQLLDYPESEPVVMTLYWVKLSEVQQQWWYTRRVPVVAAADAGIQEHQPKRQENLNHQVA